jgi:hypothetical protein
MGFLSGLRRANYRTARILGDVQAVSKGPGAVGRRVVSRQAYRVTNRILGKSLRGLFK